ncbi:MAG: septum formation inhibitor Maf [Maribacter sp.]|nr:septum formation inhibitor Maf [Maribacter sp.]
MKKWIRFEFMVILFVVLMCTIGSCKENKIEDKKEIALNENIAIEMPKRSLSKEFKDYWYAGDAEITSYTLEQARYGEIREGSSVLIYVTEYFVSDKQVKADRNNPSNIPVLKLNSTKNYLTGIYPYSIMSSSFYPVYDNEHALKLTFSAQEWCGQVFAQLNNREKFELKSFSYFENEGDKDIDLDKNVLENELWNKIRINPNDLPIGELKIIPSMEYVRLSHKALKAYVATVHLETSEGMSSYTISYPELERTLEINFKAIFPYTIEGWSETFKSGFGDKTRTMTSKATKIKTLKTPYWRQNGNSSLALRDTLGL